MNFPNDNIWGNEDNVRFFIKLKLQIMFLRLKHI